MNSFDSIYKKYRLLAEGDEGHESDGHHNAQNVSIGDTIDAWEYWLMRTSIPKMMEEIDRYDSLQDIKEDYKLRFAEKMHKLSRAILKVLKTEVEEEEEAEED